MIKAFLFDLDDTLYPERDYVLSGFKAVADSLARQTDRWPEEIHLMLCTLDEPESLEPQGHVYVAEQIEWLKLADDLPRYAGASSDGDASDPD